MADKRYIIEDNAAAGIRMVFVLIVINVIVYILQQLPGGEEMSSSFALSASAVREGEIWRLFSYMFLHAQGNILHILLNMWGLYLFGGVTAAALGPRRFLALYFLSGLAGALFWLIFNWDTSVLVVGASGAVFGVMMAAATFR